MSVTKPFRQKVRAVRIRCGINLLLRHTGRVLAVGGVVAGLAILIDKLLAVPVLTPWAIWGFWGVAAGLVLFFWLVGLPSRMQASLLLDERLKLRERFSTTLALMNSDDPFARAARAESLHAVEKADLRGHFRIGLPRSGYYGAGIWLTAIVLALYMPQKDLLGLLKKKEQQQKQALQLENARTEVEEVTKPIKAVVQELHVPMLEDELKKLDEVAQAGEPQEVKRQAIKTLGDIAERIKQMQTSPQISTADVLQQMLKQLRGSTDPFSQQIRMALAKGDFAQVANMLSQLQSQLGAGSLPDEKRKKLAEQMQQLASDLQKLDAQKRQIEDELERLGLDRKLSQADPNRLRQVLQQQGIKADLIEQLAGKVGASQAACACCANLGGSLAGVGGGDAGLSANDLSETIDQLNALDAMQQQAIMLQASLDEISHCVSSLGQGMCDGSGENQWQRGQGGGHGDGIGLSSGSHEITSDPLAANKVARAPSRPGDDALIVASWYFKDAQVKGEARRPFVEVVQAGRASAAEAISENRIPRRYEEAVKTYFNQLEESGPKP